jgi:hypothetical protein
MSVGFVELVNLDLACIAQALRVRGEYGFGITDAIDGPATLSDGRARAGTALATMPEPQFQANSDGG